MKELKKEDIKQEVFDFYDAYAHNKIDRRELMQKLSTYAVGGVTVTALSNFIMPDYVNTQQVKSDDPRVKSEYITYSSQNGGGELKALLSKPAGAVKPLGGIVVVHENRGLNPHIEDVGRRAALAGFISIAPDALSPLGGYPGNDDDGREMQRKRDRNEMLEDFIAAHNFIKNHKDCNGKTGVVGFCFGGWISNMMAVRLPDLNACVPFYGGQPLEEDVPKIQSPLLLHYAGLDTRVNAGWPEYEASLKKNNKEYQAFIYEGANHGFHNDTTPRYHEEAAHQAWNRTINFFEQHLS